MGLILPGGPSWAYCSHNMPASPNVSTFGTAVTTGTANADGADTAVLPALSHDVEYLRIVLSGTFPASTQDNASLMDVLIDPAGGTNWSVLIPNLLCNCVNLGIATGTTVAYGNIYDFPLWIPAGASLGARIRCAGASAGTVAVVFIAKGGNANPASWAAGQRVTAIGVTPAASSGQSHTTGSGSSFSSWANLGAPLAADCLALQWACGGQFASNAWSGRIHHLEFGVGDVAIDQPLICVTGTSEVGSWMSTGPIFKKLPAGSQLTVRGKTSSAGLDLAVAAYAVH